MTELFLVLSLHVSKLLSQTRILWVTWNIGQEIKKKNISIIKYVKINKLFDLIRACFYEAHCEIMF